jgi:hypothetical protein
VQTPLAQSVALTQGLPAAHPDGQLPPQSTAVSAPFLTPSLQLGAWHTLPAHDALAQSAPVRQALPGAQRVAQPPLQSTSVSVPFATPSVHVGA